MMLHDKMLNGQFLLDMKKDFTPSPETSPSPTKMDFYNAFRFRAMQQIEEAEALDLSRRDSVETRKTPSPYNISLGTGSSPSTHCGSPATTTLQNGQILHHNLLYGSNLSPSTMTNNNGFLPAAMAASLYPMYYPKIKQEIQSPPLPSNNSNNHYSGMYGSNATNLLQSINMIKNTVQMPIENDMRPNMDTNERLTDISIPKPSSMTTFSAPPPAKIQKLNNNNTDSKTTRPFKAFPRDPLVIAANFAASDVLLDNPRVERYTEYRKRVLEQIRSSNGGHRTVTNPKMRRTNIRQNNNNNNNEGFNSDNQNSANSESEDRAAESSDNDSTPGNYSNTNQLDDSTNNNLMDQNGSNNKDAAYFERRRKNNAAAKKSRDRRRIKEDEIAIRAAYLERQNIELLCQIDSLKAQLQAANRANQKC